MKIITKYLGRTIASYILLVTLLLFGLHAFLEFMREFSNIGVGAFGLLQVLAYVSLMLPSDIYQFFPMAGLLGCIIALGLLASHSELIVMRSAGVSLFEITLAVAKAAIILVVVMFIVGEVIAPMAQRKAIKNKALAMSGGQTIVTRQGAWIRSSNDFLHIDLAIGKKELRGITRYEFNADRKLKTASYAEKGVYQDGKWIFKNIKQTVFADEEITSATFSEQAWDVAINPNLVGLVQIDPDQKNLIQLYSYVKHRKLSGLNVGDYEFIFWQRIFAPLVALIMILLAIPFVFGPLRSASMGLRMLVGIVVGFGFYITNQFVGPMSVVYQVPPALASLLPMIMFMIIGWLLLLKAR